MVEPKELHKRLAFIRTVVRKNPVAADGLIADLQRDLAAQAEPRPELKQLEIPEGQYTKIKGSITGPKQ